MLSPNAVVGMAFTLLNKRQEILMSFYLNSWYVHIFHGFIVKLFDLTKSETSTACLDVGGSIGGECSYMGHACHEEINASWQLHHDLQHQIENQLQRSKKNENKAIVQQPRDSFQIRCCRRIKESNALL